MNKLVINLNAVGSYQKLKYGLFVVIVLERSAFLISSLFSEDNFSHKGQSIL